jgi:hypothetical protein
MDTLTAVLIAALAVSEALALLPWFKGNSVITQIIAILKFFTGKKNVFFWFAVCLSAGLVLLYLESGEINPSVIMAGFTLAGFTESVALGTASEKLTAIVDEHIKTEGDDIIVPEFNKLLGILPVGLDIQNVQLASPSLRTFALLDVAPVENTALPVFPPDPVVVGESFLELREDEALNAYAGNSNAGAQQESVLVFMSDDNVSPIAGRIHTIKATATAPATAYQWASAQITLAQSLPVGVYQLVGARCEQANTIAFRFVFIGGIWRPGMAAVAAISAKDPSNSRRGALGVWGTFAHNRVPSVEFFGDGTGGAAVIYLDLIKTA